MKKLGFTIIELMISVAILSILVMLAVPNYTNYLRKNEMKEAVQVVLKDFTYLEKWYSQCGSYGRDSSSNSIPACYMENSATANLAWPSLPYLYSPESGTRLYVISFTTSAPSSTDDSVNYFRLKATPVCNTVVADNGCVCMDQDANVILNANASCNNAGGLCACTN